VNELGIRQQRKKEKRNLTKPRKEIGELTDVRQIGGNYQDELQPPHPYDIHYQFSIKTLLSN